MDSLGEDHVVGLLGRIRGQEEFANVGIIAIALPDCVWVAKSLSLRLVSSDDKIWRVKKRRLLALGESGFS